MITYYKSSRTCLDIEAIPPEIEATVCWMTFKCVDSEGVGSTSNNDCSKGVESTSKNDYSKGVGLHGRFDSHITDFIHVLHYVMLCRSCVTLRHAMSFMYHISYII